MSRDEALRDNLCSYDPRNPIYADLAACRDPDEPMPRAGAKGCGCDNCFYGRHWMAAELLAHPPAAAAPSRRDD